MTEQPPPEWADVERDLEKTRIRIVGARMVWAGWARDQANRAAALNDRQSDGDAQWQALIPIDQALQRAETEVETALLALGNAKP